MRQLLNNVMSSARHYSNPRVGVMLSGGPDSAILYYLLVKENIERRLDLRSTQDQYEIVPMCAPKKDGADHYAELINKEVHQLLGRIDAPPILYIGNPWQNHDVIVTNAIVNALYYNVVSRVFVADNITPPAKFPGLEPQRVRSTHKEVIQPFFDLTKDRILDLFYTNGVSDLLKITHTCTEQPKGRCGQCWQCHERAWGFEQLGLKDPGSE